MFEIFFGKSPDVLECKFHPLNLYSVNGSWSSGNESAADSGKSTCTPTVNNGAVTIKIINKTNITSTKGVTFISLIGSFFERLKLKAILNYRKKSFEKLSILENTFESLLNLLYATTAGIAANKPSAVANRASAIPGATIAKLVFLEIAID